MEALDQLAAPRPGRAGPAGWCSACAAAAMPAGIAGGNYAEWIAQSAVLAGGAVGGARGRARGWPGRPLISVLMPTYNPRPARCAKPSRRCAPGPTTTGSSASPTMPRPDPQVAVLLEAAAAEDSASAGCIGRSTVTSPRASNSALALAGGDWVALMDRDDLLAPDAAAARCPCAACRSRARAWSIRTRTRSTPPAGATTLLQARLESRAVPLAEHVLAPRGLPARAECSRSAASARVSRARRTTTSRCAASSASTPCGRCGTSRTCSTAGARTPRARPSRPAPSPMPRSRANGPSTKHFERIGTAARSEARRTATAPGWRRLPGGRRCRW